MAHKPALAAFTARLPRLFRPGHVLSDFPCRATGLFNSRQISVFTFALRLSTLLHHSSSAALWLGEFMPHFGDAVLFVHEHDGRMPIGG